LNEPVGIPICLPDSLNPEADLPPFVLGFMWVGPKLKYKPAQRRNARER